MIRSKAVPIAWMALIVGLLALRLPSIVQPAGGDQGLYLYEAQRILAGDVPYKDVWDQKPPGIAFLYAAGWKVWPHESLVPLADLLAAAGVAALLISLGKRRAAPNIGYAAAAVFLLFGDPSIQSLSGAYVRGQCEPFIALAVTGALAVIAPDVRRHWRLIAAGVLLGFAFWLKYNAAAYGLTIAIALWAWRPSDERGVPALVRSLAWVGAGFAIVGAAFLTYFAANGALHDLRLATIDYNLHYSDETYSGFLSVVTYPVLMLLDRGHVDMLWFLGGLGSLLLLLRARTQRSTLVWIGWLAAAMLSIAVNGQRNAPNYFVQANPALAIAAAAGLALALSRGAWLRWVTVAALVAGFWRVGAGLTRTVRWGGLMGVVENARYDLDYYRGRMDRETYLSAFKGKKFDAREVDNLARYVRETTLPADRVFVFGFSGGGVGFKSERESASRFFWSRPILIEFAAGEPGYGSTGLLADLERRAPAVVALQRELWESERFFLQQPGLRAWLQSRYVLDRETPMFSVWRKKI